jgi:hypothetical protein
MGMDLSALEQQYVTVLHSRSAYPAGVEGFVQWVVALGDLEAQLPQHSRLRI